MRRCYQRDYLEASEMCSELSLPPNSNVLHQTQDRAARVRLHLVNTFTSIVLLVLPKVVTTGYGILYLSVDAIQPSMAIGSDKIVMEHLV